MHYPLPEPDSVITFKNGGVTFDVGHSMLGGGYFFRVNSTDQDVTQPQMAGHLYLHFQAFCAEHGLTPSDPDLVATLAFAISTQGQCSLWAIDEQR